MELFSAHNWTKTLVALLIIALLSCVQGVRAEDSTSTSFIYRNAVFTEYGSESTSTSFTALDAGGQVATGEATSTSFIMRSGALYGDAFLPAGTSWRFYDDETNETPMTALAAENTAPSNINTNDIIKLRYTIADTSGIAGSNLKLKLEFSTSSDFSGSVATLVSTSTCTGSSRWCYSDGAGTDNDVITTKVLSSSDACASSIGNGCGTHNEAATTTTSFDQVKDAATEYEFTIKQSGAQANTTYFFRAFDVTNQRAVPLAQGATYPSVVAAGGNLTFIISGLPNGTSTEGITTDATTTATGVSFGTLPVSVQREAAQRLTVTTDAAEGYAVYAFATQGLMRSGAIEIVPVAATNDTPAAWAIPAAAYGAYGYHSGDDALFGSSGRFAPDNTYAKFETAAKEVAYASGPVTSESTDIVYKTEITNQQESGDYTSSVVYIVVPTF